MGATHDGATDGWFVSASHERSELRPSLRAPRCPTVSGAYGHRSTPPVVLSRLAAPERAGWSGMMRVIDDEALRKLGQRLIEVDGVVGVLLGGSRARGEHTPESDFDLGLYYRPPLDIDALQDLARDIAGPKASVTRPREWGPWVDGDGWLHIGGTAVDWIYRDLDRVLKSWEDARAGRYDFHFQIGHPFGVPDFMYAGCL